MIQLTMPTNQQPRPDATPPKQSTFVAEAGSKAGPKSVARQSRQIHAVVTECRNCVSLGPAYVDWLRICFEVFPFVLAVTAGKQRMHRRLAPIRSVGGGCIGVRCVHSKFISVRDAAINASA